MRHCVLPSLPTFQPAADFLIDIPLLSVMNQQICDHVVPMFFCILTTPMEHHRSSYPQSLLCIRGDWGLMPPTSKLRLAAKRLACHNYVKFEIKNSELSVIA